MLTEEDKENLKKLFKAPGMQGYRFVDAVRNKRGEIMIKAERTYLSAYVKGPFVLFRYDPNSSVAKLNYGRFDLPEILANDIMLNFRDDEVAA